MFEVVQFVEYRPGEEAVETHLGECQNVDVAIEEARRAWRGFEVVVGSEAYAWWVVRAQGEKLARWIADNHSHKEFAVDIRSGSLVEIRAPAG